MTKTRCAPAAKRGHRAPGRSRQFEKLIHDARDKSHPVRHSQFMVEAFHVGVNRVDGDAQVAGDGKFGPVVEHAANNLKLPPCQREAVRELDPHRV